MGGRIPSRILEDVVEHYLHRLTIMAFRFLQLAPSAGFFAFPYQFLSLLTTLTNSMKRPKLKKKLKQNVNEHLGKTQRKVIALSLCQGYFFYNVLNDI